MNNERQFLKKLYSNRVQKLPLIKYFQDDRQLRIMLFRSVMNETDFFIRKDLWEAKIVKDLVIINDEINNFKEQILTKKKYDISEYAISFSKSIIHKIENIRTPKLTKLILNDFINNVNFPNNDNSFEAIKDYEKLKNYANNYISDYLKEFSEKETVLLEKFKHIGFLNYKNIIKELEFKTTNQRLDYLKEIKLNYHDKFKDVKSSLNESPHFWFVNYSTFWDTIFGNHNLISPLSIQEPVYNKYFKNGLKEPEFTYWFLKHNADQIFIDYTNDKEFQNKINSNLREILIKAELKEIENAENKAKELLLNKELDIYRNHQNNYQYRNEIDILRVLDGNYYKENTTYSITAGTDSISYFKHKLLKPYLETQLEKIKIKKLTNTSNKPQQSTKNNNTLTKPPSEEKPNQHTNIFKNNAFEVWQSMFDAFDIKEGSRTDVRFMYEVMKNDGLIHDNIRETDIRKWIDRNDTHQITMDKLPYTNPKSNTNKKRMIIYKQSKTNYKK